MQKNTGIVHDPDDVHPNLKPYCMIYDMHPANADAMPMQPYPFVPIDVLITDSD